jgi:hypothetical protein
MYKGIAANRIVRLNLDGSLDAFYFWNWFSDNGVNVIKVVLMVLLWLEDHLVKI